MRAFGVWRLTRRNFYRVGVRAGAYECWGLHAPIPELRIRSRGGFVRARLGDIVVRLPHTAIVVKPR